MSAMEEDSVLDSDSDSDSDERGAKRIKSSDKTETSTHTNQPASKGGKDVAEGSRSDGNTSAEATSTGTNVSPVDHVLEKQACEMPSIFESDGGD